MKSLLILTDGRRINLASPIAPGTYAELEATQGRGTRKHPLMKCGGCGGGVYIRHGSTRREELFGAHFDTGNCPARFAIRAHAMSPEHKRMQEYTARAAVDGGYDADTEVRTTGRTVVDVVIDGRIGVEVQLSSLSAGAAVKRTARSVTAGLETVAWVSEIPAAPWTGKVPGYRWLAPWELRAGLPQPQSVWADGLYTFRAERSWKTPRWVPELEPLKVLVDEAVVRMAAGTIKPVMHSGFARLVRDDGLALWEEMTGKKLPPFAGRPPVRALARADEVACDRPRVQSEIKPHVCLYDGCDETPRPYENGTLWICPKHVRHYYVIRPRLAPQEAR